MTIWLRYYKTARWQRMRGMQLKRYPLCKMCLSDGVVTPATVVDHVVPHNGDWHFFILGPLQSLCATHHNSTKKQEEINGFSPQVGLDGWPTDHNHPVYANIKKNADVRVLQEDKTARLVDNATGTLRDTRARKRGNAKRI